MATKEKTNEKVEKVESGVRFFDKTDKSWYIDEDSNKLILCNSIHDLRKGKAEEYGFTQKVVSFRPYKTAKNEDRDRQNYCLFILANTEPAGFILVKSYDELK